MTLIKSEAVSRPAKVEVLVFQSGAETMSIQHQLEALVAQRVRE